MYYICKMRYIISLLFLFVTSLAIAQPVPPELSSWLINTTGATGYNGLPSNVQRVQYSDSSVYVSCSGIPGYSIGPWHGDPNVPTDQNFIFRIPRFPVANVGRLTPTPLGHVAIWTNGVSMFNAKDAHSYNNDGVWYRNAVVVEGASFDACLGHADQTGEYHHHLNPVCLYDSHDSLHHSPIIGYAFDGYPVYGAFGYANADGTGGIRRMRSSYRLRAITERTTLPDGTVLASAQYGPPISAQYLLGYFIEDYEYVPGLGDLDSNNGRFCVTPEYPNGTYAYFVTTDSTGTATYPYTIGPYYHGVVTAADIGPASGHITISEPVLTYVPSSSGITPTLDSSTSELFPNPANHWVEINYSSTRDYLTRITITDERGAHRVSEKVTGPTDIVRLDALPAGHYFVRIVTSSGKTKVLPLVKK